MSLKLAARLVVLIPAKIADITHADTNPHTLDLSAFVPPETKAVILSLVRSSGTGNFFQDAAGAGTHVMTIGLATNKLPMICPITDQELVYSLSTSGDDWDLYLLGYFVQKRTR